MAGKTEGRVDYGRAMLSKIGELEAKSRITLQTPQKILLAETGTLEQVLSILSGEGVTVRVLEQKQRGGIVSRKSEISAKSGRTLVKAKSLIHVKNVPARAMRMVMAGDRGIGSIIHDLQLETFRKITKIGYCPDSGNLFRTYDILIRGKVCFEITEEFVNFASH